MRRARAAAARTAVDRRLGVRQSRPPMARALHPDRENSYDEYPLVYQGASDDFIGPCDDVVVAEESEGIDFEGEVAVIVDEVPMRTRRRGRRAARQAPRALQRREPPRLRRARALDRVRVLQREAVVRLLSRRGHAGRAGRRLARGTLRAAAPRVDWNGEWFGSPNAREMTFTFHQLIAHVTRSRRSAPGRSSARARCRTRIARPARRASPSVVRSS